ncbi:OsmC family protein [Terriglobus tenax]|uniref:OsmC family protein n=1 Tax=Terriglobus tenax TaxID=1111115 RepID=UPI0021E0F952|nr:OsmC family protein [Terriglobus tenax]
MKITVDHMGDVQFSMKTRTHTIYTDQPTDNNGWDEAMTPPELFLSAIGSCAAFYAVAYLKKKGLPFEGTQVEIHAEKLTAPTRLGEMRIVVHTPSELSEEHKAGVDDSVHRCILHNTLTHPPEIKVEIGEPLPALAV